MVFIFILFRFSHDKTPAWSVRRSKLNLPNSSVQLRWSRQGFRVHVDSIVLVLMLMHSSHPPAHGSNLSVSALASTASHDSNLSVGSLASVAVESAVVGRGLGRGVDGPGPLVDGSSSCHAAAHTQATTSTSAVNSGEWHVGVLVLHLVIRKIFSFILFPKYSISQIFIFAKCLYFPNIFLSHLDIFSLVFEVYPGVRVAPDQDGEEHGRDDGAGEHDEQSEESLPTGVVQSSVVELVEFLALQGLVQISHQ